MTWTTERDEHTVTMTGVQTDYSPYHKHRYEVEDAQARIEIKDYDGTNPSNVEPWLHINLTETYRNSGGTRVMEKTIHVTLNAEQRKELLELLQGRA